MSAPGGGSRDAPPDQAGDGTGASPDRAPGRTQQQAPELRRAREQAEAMWAGDVASRSLGITLDAVAPGRATARMTVRPDMVNGHGSCHGGYLFLLADTAFAFACNTHGLPVVAAGADVAFLAPVRPGDELVATAVERVVRGRSGLYDVTVRCGDDVVLEFRGRSRAVPGARPAEPHPDAR